MTEETTTIPETFDLLDYIHSGTIATREVVLYADEAAGDELDRLVKALEALGWSEDGQALRSGERPQDGPLDESGDEAEIADLLEQAVAAKEALESSRSVWTVQALSDEAAREAMDSVEMPKMPTPPKESAPERERERYLARHIAYGKEREKAEREQRRALLAAAIVSVETPSGTVDGATVEQLRALDSRPGGKKWLDKLWVALEDAAKADPDVPRPTWLGRSTTSQD